MLAGCLLSVFGRRKTERGLLRRAAAENGSTNSLIHGLHLLFLLPLIHWLIERPRSHRRWARASAVPEGVPQDAEPREMKVVTKYEWASVAPFGSGDWQS
jgi:hypothetical protein